MATATNANALDFEVGSSGDDADKFSIWDTASSADPPTGGTLLWRDDLSSGGTALTANQFYRIPAGDIVLTFPEGSDGLQAAGALRNANGFVSGGVHIQLETSADAAITNRITVAEGDWTTAQ